MNKDIGNIKMKNLDKFRVFYTNAGQLPNKYDNLLTVIAGDEPDIMIITEVLPKYQKYPTLASTLDIQGYTQFYNYGNGDEITNNYDIRGITIHGKSNIICSEVKLDNSSHKDQLWIEIPLKGNEVLLCGGIYRSPAGNIAEIENSTKTYKKRSSMKLVPKRHHIY